MTLSGLFRSTTLLTVGLSVLTACSNEPQTTASDQQITVDHATLAVQDLFAKTTANSRSQKLLAQAKAVMICPSIFNMSIAFGGSGGRCVLMSRDARGSWSDPAFYRLHSGSFGLQLGVQNEELIFFIMSKRGIQALLDSQFKFDASASASFASIGTGLEDSTAGAKNTDIYAAQKAQGLYAGAAIGGSKLTSDSGANRAYYNQSVGPEDIIITMRVNNPAADPLRRAMMNAAKLPAASNASASTASANTSETNIDPVQDNAPSTQRSSITSQSLAPIQHRHR
ncbi:lipid-binding SYLF domain-containing protein [Swingsia samuiensis]|uniref:Ysc84 actin-binding domain-containing protein n=1 Tax=Swingsia samuiensis TaxID=1293412 RepID=A0A4Y6UMX7_9PROT|nr:lipid-binding SYLF domain-containing protein [Swingsia samuiensis]QDH17707.1 hypothetical protein E3D00_09115 [Swingsia samuiensis]